MLIGEEKYISRAIKLFNSSSTAIKLTVLQIIKNCHLLMK